MIVDFHDFGYVFSYHSIYWLALRLWEAWVTMIAFMIHVHALLKYAYSYLHFSNVF